MGSKRQEPRPRYMKDGAVMMQSRETGKNMCYVKGCSRAPGVKTQVFPWDVIAWLCKQHASQHRPPNENGE